MRPGSGKKGEKEWHPEMTGFGLAASEHAAGSDLAEYEKQTAFSRYTCIGP
jgi:hypothetical protein